VTCHSEKEPAAADPYAKEELLYSMVISMHHVFGA
jgi:hypothetical protein